MAVEASSLRGEVRTHSKVIATGLSGGADGIMRYRNKMLLSMCPVAYLLFSVC